jgi:DNA-binding MarR family transcriptional regulator
MSKPFTDVVLALVRQDMPDLSLRQCAVLIAVVQAEPGTRIKETTVRALAPRLNVRKPAITRAFDRLEELGLGQRFTDPTDRRSVFFVPTPAGTRMARDQMGVQVA